MLHGDHANSPVWTSGLQVHISLSDLTLTIKRFSTNYSNRSVQNLELANAVGYTSFFCNFTDELWLSADLNMKNPFISFSGFDFQVWLHFFNKAFQQYFLWVV